MTSYTGKQRVDAVFKGLFTDRIPSCPVISQCNIQLIDASVRQFLTDPKIIIQAQIAAYERYKPDILVLKGDSLMEAEAMGNTLRFPEDSICFSTKPILDDKGKLNRLKLPNPARDGRMPGFIEAVAEVNKIITDSETFTFLTGPWTIAIELRRAEELLKDAKNDRAFFHKLMRFTSRMSIGFGEALLPLTDCLIYSECYASSSFISRELYRNLVFPYHKQIVDHFRSRMAGVGLHICGYTDPILEDMVNTGATLISIDAPTDLVKALEVARGRAVVMGNINTNLSSYGTRENMRKAIEKCIHIAGRKRAYILASGCEVSSSTSPEKVGWFMELSKELRRIKDNQSRINRN